MTRRLLQCAGPSSSTLRLAHSIHCCPLACSIRNRAVPRRRLTSQSNRQSSSWSHRVAAVAVEEVEVSDTSQELEATESIADHAEAQTDSSRATRPDKTADQQELLREVARRRNFAIISHPDAGKTTMTEKLLLYGGAIHEAGEVKARRASKHATSDWMELERARGISITSTAMTFEYQGVQINLLDTPGHQDFSEDTYRTLAAADNAVMLVDGAKGIEEQTRKLFQVARLKKLPVFTFVNKMDRPSLEPFEIMEQLEKEFNLKCYAVTWPIGSGDQFVGIYHRPTKKVVLYGKGGVAGRRKGASKKEYDFPDPELAELIEPHLYEKLLEEAELLDELGEAWDWDAVLKADLTPMYFGSAINNFGVELFLQSFIDHAARPGALPTVGGGLLEPASAHFTGLVFKLQANMDPRHRDKVAFIRVTSGKFEKGMKAKVARTGRVVALSRPQRMFANDRSTVQEGFSGDVLGLTNPGAFAIGDTLYSGPKVQFPPIPSFSPELFAYMRTQPNQRKAFNKGVEGLLGEGAVQVLYSNDEYVTDPILAAVGQLQFEVVQYRMKDEYGVGTILDPLPYTMARWVLGGWDAVEAAGRLFNTTVVKDVHGRPVLLFRNHFAYDQVLASEAAKKLGELSPFITPPSS